MYFIVHEGDLFRLGQRSDFLPVSGSSVRPEKRSLFGAARLSNAESHFCGCVPKLFYPILDDGAFYGKLNSYFLNMHYACEAPDPPTNQ